MVKDTEKLNNNETLIHYSKMNVMQLIDELKTNLADGLGIDYIEEYQDEYGLNEIESTETDNWFIKVFHSFINPFSIVLLFLSAILAITKDYSGSAVILFMVMVGGITKYVQEEKSNEAGEKLKSLIRTTSTVLRFGKKQEIDIKELVVGDVVFLAAGDIIPADLRIIKSKDLFISQSNLTGESDPVEKFSILSEKTLNSDSKSPLDYENLCFMGTNVVSGSATAIIVAIGSNTCFGNVVNTVLDGKVETDFDKGLKAISYLLIHFMLVMILIIFCINGIVKKDWLNAFMFAVSIAVGLTPEMLPMIITTNLAKGAVNMSKKKTIVKNLNSIQSFGAMDVLCTDKTGTLTEDRIVLQYHLDIKGEENSEVLKYGYLNSQFQTGLKNLLDLAIIDKSLERGFFELNYKFTKIDEIPFDFVRKRMSVVLKDNNSNNVKIITKGAVEEMLSICKYTDYNGVVEELTDEKKAMSNQIVSKLNNDGMRVIAIAYKNEPNYNESFSANNENEMVLVGYLSFLDPPKASAFNAIKKLKETGVKVKVLTGDNETVSSFVCKKVGIERLNVVLGGEIENLTDDKLKPVVEQNDIFAKLTPQQKARIVRILREDGHVVGFMGDGINDAPAMKQADIGISVDTAVDVAKESADMILLKKDLTVLKDGVIEGRKIFCNILKYIKMTTSSNFGNMFSILFASVFLPFLPMLPMQILVLNLLYDISQMFIPWDEVDKEQLEKQKKWNASSIKRFMIWVGPISSIFDIATFLIMYYIFGCVSSDKQALFNTAWFVESLITQSSIVHLIRTEKIPFVESVSARSVWMSSLIVLIISCILPFSPVAKYLKMVALPFSFFCYLVVILILYAGLLQLTKKIYIKKYGDWL